MQDQIVIGVVVALVVGAHGGLYKWLRFKMDEGTILKFLQDSDAHAFRSSEAISANTNIALTRVAKVCSKSRLIERNSKQKESWCIQQ